MFVCPHLSPNRQWPDMRRFSGSEGAVPQLLSRNMSVGETLTVTDNWTFDVEKPFRRQGGAIVDMGGNRVSVAIVNYNNKEEIRRCIASIRATRGDIAADVHVFDNASRDGSADMIRSEFPDVDLIANDANIGLTRALNRILRSASGEYVLLLDSDTELKEGSLRGLVEFLDGNPAAGAAGPRIFNEDGTIQESARRFPNILSGLFGRRAMLSRLFPGNPITRKFMMAELWESEDPYPVDYVSAACMIVRRGILDRIGLLDEQFFVYWCDVDLCRRVNDQGYRVWCVPRSRIIHYERYQAHRKKNWRMIVDFHRGAYNYYRKHNAAGIRFPLRYPAFVLLMMRAATHLLLNEFKSRKG